MAPYSIIIYNFFNIGTERPLEVIISKTFSGKKNNACIGFRALRFVYGELAPFGRCNFSFSRYLYIYKTFEVYRARTQCTHILENF